MKSKVFFLVATFLVLANCGPGHLRVSVTKTLPLKFTFDGPGRWSECCSTFFEFVVMERSADEPHPWDSPGNIDDNPHLMWRVVPPDGHVVIPDAPEIAYGIVPRGWTQTHPRTGSPPVLLEGLSYAAGQPHLSPEGLVFFTVQGGKIVVATESAQHGIGPERR